jgi:hypothetical protein
MSPIPGSPPEEDQVGLRRGVAVDFFGKTSTNLSTRVGRLYNER